jgi:hypothetical protein
MRLQRNLRFHNFFRPLFSVLYGTFLRIKISNVYTLRWGWLHVGRILIRYSEYSITKNDESAAPSRQKTSRMMGGTNHRNKSDNSAAAAAAAVFAAARPARLGLKRTSNGTSISFFMSSRRLASTIPGESAVEQIAKRIERRRAARIPITFYAHVRFLHDCRAIAVANGYESARLALSDLVAYRERIRLRSSSPANTTNTTNDSSSISSSNRHEEPRLKSRSCICGSDWFYDFSCRSLWNYFGILSVADQLLLMLDRAIAVTEDDVPVDHHRRDDHDHNNNDDDDDHTTTNDVDAAGWLYYRDFCHDYTTVVSRWPWMRNNVRQALALVLVFYLATPLLFCTIIPAGKLDICKATGPLEPGWVSALYFASVTISSVGRCGYEYLYIVDDFYCCCMLLLSPRHCSAYYPFLSILSLSHTHPYLFPPSLSFQATVT